MKQVTGTLRLELAQYRELAAFAQFGTDLDKDAKMRLEKGKRLMEILRQDQYSPVPVEKQVMIFFAGSGNHLADIPVTQITRFESEFFEFMDTHHREIGKAILTDKALDDKLKQQLTEAIDEFKKIFSIDDDKEEVSKDDKKKETSLDNKKEPSLEDDKKEPSVEDNKKEGSVK